MTWHAKLDITRSNPPRTVARHQHTGPLRVLQSLYPEGDAVCHNGCLAQNHLTLTLDTQAEFIDWDITAFGLPSAGLPFVNGGFLQHIEVAGVWLERGYLNAADTRLMDGTLGLALFCDRIQSGTASP